MSQDSRSKLERRVVAAAQTALARQKFVSPVDVLAGIGWLPPGLVDDWRHGRVDHLERGAAVPPDRLAVALCVLRRWAQSAGLQPGEVAYVTATRDRRPLRFTANGDAIVEGTYRTHWTSPGLSETARERLTQRQNTPPDLVVISPLRGWTCADCEGTGTLLVMEDDMPLCLTCADMGHLIFLPAGDAALTRRAKKASTLSAVVVRFSRARKRYERQGILVEQAALEAAEQQCLGDEGARQQRRERDRQRRASQDLALMARMTREIIRLYPACPASRAESIAAHSSVRGSGRVGRSAAGRALADDAINRAVIASVRHEDTDYDRLLMSGVARADARERVRDSIDRVLDAWRGQP
ncbi:MAG TPA: DUF2293 domain-containing protein [Planosporangium sp.]|jgi:hypothetical protein|nr:DUF2293 domain-containing protein [Planosporangium sp.]